MNDIDRQSRQYAKQGLFLAVAMFLLALVIMQVCGLPSIFTAVAVSAVFSVVFDAIDSVVWRKVAEKNPSFLPVFYTSVSGFRMLSALIVMLVYYLVAGRGAMLSFFIVFMAFYVVLLIHHTAFFMRVSNGTANTIKADKAQ